MIVCSTSRVALTDTCLPLVQVREQRTAHHLLGLIGVYIRLDGIGVRAEKLDLDEISVAICIAELSGRLARDFQ